MNDTPKINPEENNQFTPLPACPEPLNRIIEKAVIRNASDIHLDTLSDGVMVRYRVDGELSNEELLTRNVGQRVLNQVRVIGKLDIERIFAPLESQIQWTNGKKKTDLRVTIIPTGDTEAIHLRILASAASLQNIDALGFSEEDLEKVRLGLKAPHGLILVTGPTGSGKTTSIYTLAASLDLESRVAVSIEDPIEFDLPNVRQLEVDEKHGLTMYEGLRTLLRMDPDIIIIGEIRDTPSAVTAVRAAMAGRLVFASIHGFDAASAIEALHQLSVPYYLIADALRLITAQNLVLKICSACKKTRPLYDGEQDIFKEYGLAPPTMIHQSVDCRQCRFTCNKGRIGVFETVLVDKEVSKMIASGSPQHATRTFLKKKGIQPLLYDAVKKVSLGLTSIEEFHRINWTGEIETPYKHLELVH